MDAKGHLAHARRVAALPRNVGVRSAETVLSERCVDYVEEIAALRARVEAWEAYGAAAEGVLIDVAIRHPGLNGDALDALAMKPKGGDDGQG